MLDFRRIARIVSLTVLVVCIQSSSGIEKQDYVSVSVLVRDHHGEPVAGLTAQDFTVEEHGQNYPVDTVWQLSPLPGDEQAAKSPHSLPLEPRPEAHTAAQLGQTHLLLLLPPNMEAGTRHFMLKSTTKYISLAIQHIWQVAILDPANRFTSYTGDGEKLIKELQHLQKRRDPKQYNARWIEAAGSAIRDLGALPGRHMIVLACDTHLEDLESDGANSVPLNPHLLRVTAANFESDAKAASAQLYLIQASGPGTVLPFGEAAGGGSNDLLNPGPLIADHLSAKNADLERMHRELLIVADHTGGRVEMDMGDALRDAAKDAAGYYELRFRPDPSRLEGAYHHITISVRQPHLRVISNSYYLAPQALASAQLAVPAILTKALSSRQSLRGITVKPRAWYFPDRSDAFARVPLAAEIQLDPKQAHTSKAPDSVHVVAALFYGGQNRILGTSSEMLHWEPLTRETTQNGGRLSTTWHEDLLLPPGSYDLRVAALDDASGVVGSASWRFLIHPSAPAEDLAVSSLVLATHCLSSQELASTRRDLLNPFTRQDCTLQPVSAPSFSQTDTVRLLMKLYPGRNMKHFPEGWTTTLSVSGAENTTGLSLPLKIESSAGVGWTIYSELPLKNLGIGRGDHELTVTVSGPGKRSFSQKEHFSVREAQ